MHSGDVREVFVTLRKPTQLKILVILAYLAFIIDRQEEICELTPGV